MAMVINSLLQSLGKTEAPITVSQPAIDRTHFGPSNGHHHIHSYHGSSHKNGKHGIALSALTLLSFLFFLNILQNCLQEHMNSMRPQVVVMQARIDETKEAQKRKGEVEEVFLNVTPEYVQETKEMLPVKLKTKDNP